MPLTPLAAVVPMAGGLLCLGLYGCMRFLPLGQTAVPIWSDIFVGVGAVAVIFGILVGLTQLRCRTLLAYSSISQMGLMTLGVGIGLGSPDNWSSVQLVLLLFALHHALAKGALFFGLGVEGRARLGLWLPALVLAGLPFTGGARAKGLLKTQVTLLTEVWSTVAAWVIPLGSVGTTLLMLRFLYLAFDVDSASEKVTHWVWWPLLLGMLLMPWIVPLPLERISPFWGSLWPLFLAVIMAWFFLKSGFERNISKIVSIPPGDFLVFAEKLIERLPQYHDSAKPEHMHKHETVIRPITVPNQITLLERILSRWQEAIGILLVMVTCIFLLGLG
jgi:formate hydrogenlyase subunit 3/multisubunit Na+/H+ antiporter MnhD subunit